jgi:dihydropyrimidinase
LDRRISINKFVELSSSNPAKLYGMGDMKGTIAPGYDADLAIWYPTNEQCDDAAKRMEAFNLTNSMLHHDIDFSPFEGFRFVNWPRITILRGKVVWDRDNGGVNGKSGFGKYLKRGSSTLSKPRDIWINEFRAA